MTELTRDQVAQMVDHTLLKPEATPADVQALIADAERLGAWSVCVSPSMLPIETSVKVAVVCGFPSGKHTSAVKAAEAAESVRLGADEIDMVIDVGAAVADDVDAIEADVAAVRAACEGAVLKVIIESAALTDEQVVGACQAAEAAGADFVKTSTGFHPSGGATAHAVRLMRETVGDRLGVKASGGIRTAEAAREMIEAGATRLGLSGTEAVLDGWTEQAG
ncbi:deoxyribose-phosphate aldolase [Arsenicicoccus dermatophilus]|uniref:deoxyribose-phosphate aldolase n=1 Tax=Arsenicicoccus dermatophilus TaxID=1076331 RepID=UPI001F4CD206|nr:deoxyribose-phosphate aldolase [Arsenicicoccus dermatophilus]MCH8612066.1 deoxyribose-phosphate aldolase [Arsenicicoccus dermatophilus]